MLYMSKNRLFGVVVGMQGTYDIVEVVPAIPSKEWPVKNNRDWLTDAKTICDQLDADAS